MADVDIVTVWHNDRNYAQHLELFDAITLFEGSRANLIAVDNSVLNRGYALGAIVGATKGTAPIIGFLNPDATVRGPFVDAVVVAFGDSQVVCVGERFGKPEREVRTWGLRDWVCGGCCFWRRDWFEEVGGYDPDYRFGWEETDLQMRAQRSGKLVRSIRLPIEHSSPDTDTPEDSEFKRKWFNYGARRYRLRWQTR